MAKETKKAPATTTPVAPVKPATLDELKATLATAIATNDDNLLMSTIGAMAKAKSEIAKAQAEQARKESEALAGAREKLASEIFGRVKGLNLAAKLEAVKAHGFTFTVDGTPEGIAYKSVALSVPSIKRARGAGAGKIGKTKDEYGMSLGEMVDKFGTAEEKAAISAEESNSKQWLLKVAVKKRVIKEGLIQPVK